MELNPINKIKIEMSMEAEFVIKNKFKKNKIVSKVEYDKKNFYKLVNEIKNFSKKIKDYGCNVKVVNIDNLAFDEKSLEELKCYYEETE